MVQKAFEIGNSVAVTVPKKVGLKAGARLRFRKDKNKLVYEILDTPSKSEIERKIRDRSGGFKVDVPNLMEAIKYLREHQYDPKIRLY